VQFITVSPTNVPIMQEWIGTLEGAVNAQIRAQVSGYLLSQNYKEGTEVQKGQLLFEIDPRPFQATLGQAQAKLAQDEAQLHKTELDVKRYTPLAKDQAISQEDLDNAIQANLAARAQVSADRAAITNSELNLSFTKVISPIRGLAGIALAQIGDLVGPNGNLLTTVSSINPIRVYFPVSEDSYLTYWRRFLDPENTDTNSLSLKLVLTDGSAYPYPGKFYIADRSVNTTTGTLLICGIFPNPNLLLRPGQYARIRAQTLIRTNVFVIPQRAITEMQGTIQVSVVGNDNKSHIKAVTTGEQIGSDVVVEKGLDPGERLIVEGVDKAKEGTVVNPQPYAPNDNTNNPVAQPAANQTAK
ncbi:MAG: efflux RND transporter periplasmic adaptor subunit, partial [Limisphaerales bacterium]